MVVKEQLLVVSAAIIHCEVPKKLFGKEVSDDKIRTSTKDLSYLRLQSFQCNNSIFLIKYAFWYKNSGSVPFCGISNLRAQTLLRGVVAPCYQHHIITKCHNSTQRCLSP